MVPDDEWIIVQKNTPWGRARNDPRGHGTQVTSKICGLDTGVTKKTTIIPVKFDVNTLQSYILIWKLILEDIYARRKTMPPTALPGKTVINYSHSVISKFQWDERGIQNIKPIMAELMSLGVVIVVSAGNARQDQGGNPAILRPPASWASSDFPIIVVSAVDREFKPEPYSNYGPQTSVWAIGQNNLVAMANSDDGYYLKPGTSFGTFQCLLRLCDLILTKLHSCTSSRRSSCLLPLAFHGPFRDYSSRHYRVTCIQLFQNRRWRLCTRTKW